MEAEILILILYMAGLGAAIGTFTGLVPGIHVNTLAAVMLAMYSSLEKLFSGFIPQNYIAICVSSSILSASIVHSFVDFVPSVFIGAPDADDAVSMLPGHRLLSEGRGMCAVRAAAIGSCVGACISVAVAIPLQFLLIGGLGEYLNSITLLVLCIALLILFFHEKNFKSAAAAFVIFIVSGALGLCTMDLKIPCTGLFGEGTLLFPMLTGLFGMPAILTSLKKTEIVKQRDDEKYPVGIFPGIKGVLTGIVTGWFPGITSTTGAIISSTFMPEKKPEGFISMTSSIGTAASVMMLVTLSVTGKGRSGTMLIIKEILGDSVIGFLNGNFLLLLLSAAIATLLGYAATILCGKAMSRAVSKINISVLNRICLILIVSLVLVFTGPFGILILAVSTVIGFLPVMFGIGRVYLTGCLILPTVLTYLGVREIVLTALVL